jgi:rubredoxin
MEKWKCKLCGYIYNSETGDEKHRIEPGTLLDDLPEKWTCPSCGAKKKIFSKVE